jgi:hypothetical protein
MSDATVLWGDDRTELSQGAFAPACAIWRYEDPQLVLRMCADSGVEGRRLPMRGLS